MRGGRHGKLFAALSNRRIRVYDGGMRESFTRLRVIAWPLILGAIAGGAAVLFAGPGLFWALVALGLAAALIVQFVSFQEPILRAPEQAADDPLAALPPMTRVLMDQLPIP